MTFKTSRSFICGLLILIITSGLLRADRAADLRNEIIPPGAVMKPPLRKYAGPVPASGGPTGYTPQQLRHAYGFDQLNTTGEGQVIAIVDAYGSPTIQADLDTFCAQFNIPSTTVRVYYPQGYPGIDDGWATETSLDVEWAHAIAPGATIVLVASPSPSDSDLYAAVDYAVSLGATQVSMSWVGPEYSTETSSDFHFNVPGVTFFASSGDNGAYMNGPIIGVSYPACSPYVAGVGGTTLGLDASGNITSETAWSGSGGGVSLYEMLPSYQASWDTLSGATRGVPDVAYDADPATGVPVYMTGPGWQQYGGTSMSAPQWAALSSLANSLRQQSANSAPGVFYSLATSPTSPNYATYFHDIASGNNEVYSAGAGYDLVTGLGSPLANQLVVALAGGYSTQAAAPVFFPPPGSYLSGSMQNVTIVSATPGASIRYTTDGSTPTETSGVLYSGPVPISADTTLTAVAYGSGLTDSPVTSGNYSFLPQAAAPTFSPAAGIYKSAQTVAISTATSGATIRYTTDGSTPTETNGTVYSSLLGISGNTVLNAIAYENGYIDSPVTSGTYTIDPAYVLYDFTQANNIGIDPWAGLVQGSDGNFYGTTSAGGANNDGTVYMMTPAGVVTTLAAFTGASPSYPDSALIQGSDGSFYGVTLLGGSSNYGTVFKVTPAGAMTTLASFAGANSEYPYASLVQGSDGNFYGTTRVGGANNDGTVFMMTPAGVMITLVSFNGANNGRSPYGSLVQGPDGNFYGTTASGGAFACGTAFKMTPTGVLTALVSFNGRDGLEPLAALTLGYDGNFYGTTGYGGEGYNPSTNNYGTGTVFKMTPAGLLTSLYSFSPVQGHPITPLVQRIDGNFYGVTGGGGNDEGSVYKITPAGVFTTLGTFADPAEINPNSLIQGGDGNLYGTTEGEGLQELGLIYKLVFPPQVAPPAFSPAAGIYSSAQTVTISTTTSGASIRYTKDGSTPSETAGTLYTSPVSISATTTLNAIAYKSGMADSIVASGYYVIGTPSQVAAPVFSPPSGTYTAAQAVTIATTTSGASISYTTDGSTPTEANGTLYSGPVSIGATTTLQAIAFKPEYTDSNVTSGKYTVNLPPVAPPTFTPPAGTYAISQTVTITTTTSGASIRYTLDGSAPSETAGTLYSGPVSINLTETLKAIAYETGMTDSTITSGLYSLTTPSQVTAPTFSLAAGTYPYSKAVAISTPTSGASIRYTTDGSMPTETMGTPYTGPFSIDVSETLQAVAYKSGLIDSTLTSANYTINSLNLFYSMTSAGPLDAALVLGTDGSFYGNGNDGTLFKITPAGVFTTLASLAGANGANPFRGMIQATDGNFYGMAYQGGANNDGTVFRMTPSGILTALASFNGANGANPLSVLVQATDGNFYGTTMNGGSSNEGTVFKMTPAGALTTLVSFTGSNGASPQAGLVQGTDGNFYGTTSSGGSANEGTVFMMTPLGVLTTLVNFNGPNGRVPYAALVQANDGNFYGVTDTGGSTYVSAGSPGYGTAFKMTPAGVLTTLVSFDGNTMGFQDAKLVQGRDGNFYSTTYLTNNFIGNNPTVGNVFRMTPEGVVTILGWFPFLSPLGANPFAGLVQGTDGNFYGTTEAGGSSGLGTIFQLVLPPQVTAPVFSPGAGNYTGAQTVTLSTTTTGASIRYTTDGSIPTEATGTLYSGPVSIGATTTLKAVAYEMGYTDSRVTSGLYTIGSGSITISSSNGFDNIPMSSSQSGTFTATFDASPSLFPSNAVIALSKGTPTAYTGLSCIARFNTSGDIDAYNGTGYQATSVIPYAKGLTYHFRMVVNVPANTYSIYVTPPSGSELTVGLNYKFRKAVTSLDGWTIDVNASPGGSVTVSNRTIMGTQQVAAPTYNPPAGTYPGAQAVTITSATSGALIAYTTDGSTPAESGGTVTHGAFLPNGGSVSISVTTTLKALAFKGGMLDSTVATGLYTISTPQVAAPVFNPGPGIFSSPQSVTITSATSGALVAYTTDGSTPTESGGTVTHGTLLPNGGSVAISATTTLNALALKGGMLDSMVTSGLYTISLPQVVAPTFNPPAGTYSSAQTVTITSATSDATIAYTTDGSTPAESDGLVMHGIQLANGGSVAIGATTTLKALAFKGGMLDSMVTTGLYTISLPQVAAPTLNPPAGTYAGAQTVTITSATSGATIAYTTDGTTPTESGGAINHGIVLFNGGAVTISATCTLKALAFKIGMTDSTVTAGLYTIGMLQVAAPTFNPPAGTYTSAQSVTITSTTSGASIRYTTDGSTPSETAGTLYTGSISISITTPLKALAFITGRIDSPVTTGTYAIYTSTQPPSAPVFSPGAGTYTSAPTVTITSAGATSIYYTTNGSTPTSSSTPYTGPIVISTSLTLEAIGTNSSGASPVTAGQYTINLPQVAAPTFNPPAGTYTSAQTATITSATNGATIVYTTDGSTPTESGGTVTHGTLLSNGGSVAISATCTLKALAFKTGMTDSTVATGIYTITVVTRSLTGSSGNGWHALALTSAQAGTFTATFDATPTVSPENAVVGLSKGVATAYTGLSCIARFNTTGQIDAYNGTGYQAASAISYTKNTAYHFRMVVNVPAHTYSVYVTPAGGTELTVGLNYDFRGTAVVSSLDTWNLDVNATPSGCSLTANNLNP